LNQHVVQEGFNLFCSDIGDAYYLHINSSKAFNFLKDFNAIDPTDKHNKKFIERRKYLKSLFKSSVDVSGLPSYLDIEFESPIWEKWGVNASTAAHAQWFAPPVTATE